MRTKAIRFVCPKGFKHKNFKRNYIIASERGTFTFKAKTIIDALREAYLNYWIDKSLINRKHRKIKLRWVTDNQENTFLVSYDFEREDIVLMFY